MRSSVRNHNLLALFLQAEQMSDTHTASGDFTHFFFLFFCCWLDDSSNQRMWVPESPCVTALNGADLLLIILSVFTLYSKLCHKVFV